MNNNHKIQALMVYYQHWGNEQNHKRKIIDGLTKLKKCVFEYTETTMKTAIHNYDILDNEEAIAEFEEHLDKLRKNPSSLYECLQKGFDDEPLFQFEGESRSKLSYYNCLYFIQVLFENHTGLGDKKLPTEEDILDQKKNSLDYFCDMSEEAYDILYDDDFTEEHVLSVEAIVALM